MANDAVIPNHHADHEGFSGFVGLLAALSMVAGREGDARFAARLGGVGSSDVVVDVGCGPGAAVRHAARLGATVIGVDPAPVMLRVARALTRSTNARYVEGTAEALPIEDDAATVVWSIATVHHWRDIDRGLREVRRVLGSAGRFIAIERATTAGARGLASHGWTHEQGEEFARRCSANGLVDVHVERAQPTRRRSLLAVVATAA
jgi:ubiquinone/menaquinone biosynthesis C-methylase UbiE